MESDQYRRANLIVQELTNLYAEGHDAALSTALKLLEEMYGQEVTYTEEEAKMFRFGFRMMIRNRPKPKSKAVSASGSGIKVPAYLQRSKLSYTEQFHTWASGEKLLP